jgi:ATP-dependent helicase HrpB
MSKLVEDLKKFSPLPVDNYLDQALELVEQNSSLIVSAAPGAGKTTRIPWALLNHWQGLAADKKIIVLEPRRIAALSAAQYISELMRQNVGDKIGYQVRFDSKISSNTQLVFMTEALLSKKMIDDPNLENVQAVILDEFHERSLNVDIALGLLKELQMLSRPDLKIIVMSATIDSQSISAFLNNAPILNVPGKIFPLTINKSKKSQLLVTNQDFIDRTMDAIKEAVSKSAKHTLVFIPGVGEIERLFNTLETSSSFASFQICKLHGQLSLDEQKKVLAPSEQRKIILSTNIAESSLTIDGLDTVVDSGLQRQTNFDPVRDITSLEIQRISQASAQQRAGRAARQFPGFVYQMWTTMDEISMPKFDKAELHRNDLSETILTLVQLGISSPQSFSWYEPPPTLKLQSAFKKLVSLGAIDEKGKITEIGSKMSAWPLGPRFARLMLAGIEHNCPQFAAEIASLLSEKDLTKGSFHHHEESDVLFIYEQFLEKKNSANYRQINKSIEQLCKIAKRITQKDLEDPSKLNLQEKLNEILWPAYSDQLCRRRRANESAFLMRSGQGAALDEKSSLKHAEWALAINGQGEKIRWAHSLPFSFVQAKLSHQIKKTTELVIDEKTKRVIRREWNKIDQLTIGDPIDRPASAEEIQQLLPIFALQNWDLLYAKNEKLKKWLDRFQWYSQISGAGLTEEIKQQAIEAACFGEKSIEQLFEKDLIYFFESQFPANLIADFHSQAPETITVPTGNSYPIQYMQHRNPILEVRLQEIFGWSETPKLANGSVSLTLSLLAPNFRPVQMTSDLKSFWQNAYTEVKKELRTRYPKHSWPEDPLTAKPEAKGRRRT